MSDEKGELTSLDIGQLMELLPHRYPFLLVDKIVDIDGDQSARGIKNVTVNEPHFTGHFPHAPIMPGVLLVEGMAQTAGAVVAHEHYTGEPKTTYFMTIDKAKFRKTVVPGDTVEYVITKKTQKRNIFKFKCIAEVAGQKVAEAEIGAMMMAREDQ
ncbi:MAG: 3-hydroxyacyl-ACP dehydratase FabZ [Rhizobiaceae bacterium]